MRSLYERLDSKLEPDLNGGCLLWSGAVTPHGYGVIGLGQRFLGLGYAHRVAFERAFGEVPDGLQVCHRCDTLSCCNPEHLFGGSPQANTADMVQKRRHAYGERNGHAKLTDVAVQSIRRDRRSGVALVEAYGVSANAICQARRAITWKHVA